MEEAWDCRDLSSQALGQLVTEPSQPDQIEDVTWNFSSRSGSCFHSVLIYSGIQICTKLGI